MARSVRRGIIRACATVILVACVPTPIDSAYWWRSPRVVTALGLSAAQARSIDRIYRETLPERLARARRAEAAHVHLEHLLETQGPAEDFELAATQAANADAAMSRARTLMLYRMSRVLTRRQRVRFDALARRRRQRRRPR
jgi:hypothetical protein